MGTVSRKALSALLAVTLAVGPLPAPALAEMAEEAMGTEPVTSTQTPDATKSGQGKPASPDQAQPQTLAPEGELATEDQEPQPSNVPADNALTPEATPAPAQSDPELAAENDTEEGSLGQQLSVQAVDASRYTYQVRPLLSPFNRMVYVQTDNPDPTSFRLKDKSSRYRLAEDVDGAFMPVTDTFTDVVYENIATHRVKGGYIFEDDTQRNDGGQLSVQAKSGDSYVDTGRTVQLPALKDVVDYLLENCTNTSAGFFERVDAVESYLYYYSIYPTPVFDMSKPNKERPYPFLATSPYWELNLNEHFEMYERSKDGMLLKRLYPLVLDSLGYPYVIELAAKRLNANCTCETGDTHASMNVTLNGTTHYYYGAGGGGNDPVFSSDVAKSYRFDGSSGDASTEGIVSAHDRLMAYKTQATRKMATYYDQVQGATFRKTIGKGSWIRVASEGGFSYGTSFAYIVGMPNNGDYSIACDAWVDGRYVSEYEKYVPGAKFSEYPRAGIVERNVTFTDLNGVKHTSDMLYRYNESTGTWDVDGRCLVGVAYDWDQDAPGVIRLTENEVRALVPDRNTRVPIEQMLIYDGTAAPGTPHGTVHVASVQIEQSKDIPIESSFWIDVKILPENADFKYYTLTSSDPSVVSVEGSSITGHKLGTAVLTATSMDGNKSATCRVTVWPSVTSVTLDDVTIKVGQTVRMKPRIEPSNTSQKIHDWTSSAPEVATVDANGNVRGVSPGYTYVWGATFDGRQVGAYVAVTGETSDSGSGNNASPGDGSGSGSSASSGSGRSNASRFPDVAADAWYAGVVGRAAGLRLINGYKDGRFGPNDKVTRGQVAVILWNMAGKPAPRGAAKAFPDVAAGKYYYDAVRWASSVGVVNGYGSGKFGPEDPVTREQLAAMLANYARKVAGRDTAGSAADYRSMKDAAKVSGWAAKSVGWCFRNKILSGTKDGRVNPQGNATRAEAAKMVVFFHDML